MDARNYVLRIGNKDKKARCYQVFFKFKTH